MTRASPAPGLALPEDHPALAVARAVEGAGGRAWIVGGWVRDGLLGLRDAFDDLDVEVAGLSAESLEAVLAGFGKVRQVGRAFPVYLVSGLGLDVSLPDATDFAEAARRRDLRVNAMGWDPLTGRLEDPHGGRDDLRARRLRAVDPSRFGEDPLRGLRVAQLAARLDMDPDPELRELCAATDLDGVAPERIFGEWRRILLRSSRPSVALGLLPELGLLRFFPELERMRDVPQDPVWHPEGDVWVHVGMVVDRAAALRRGEERRDLLLMFGALCHDLGKPETTREQDGRTVSPKHSEAGVAPSRAWLERMRAPGWLVEGVAELVRYHLAPAQYVRESGPAGAKAYRRLARRLAGAGLDFELLHDVARSDHLGRTTEEAVAGRFPAGETFLARAREIDAEPETHAPAVRGAHLLARGMEPGPELGAVLARCREVQDETGWSDVDRILARVLGDGS